MVVLGFIIALIAVAFGAGVLLENRTDTPFSVFGLTIDHGVSGAAIFLAGMLAMFLLLLGLWMMKRGMGRSLRKRREVKALRNRAEEAEAERQAEREAQARREAELQEAPAGEAGGPAADPAGVAAEPAREPVPAQAAPHPSAPAEPVASGPVAQQAPQQAPQHAPQPVPQQQAGTPIAPGGDEPVAPPSGPYQPGAAGPAAADPDLDDGPGRHAR